MRILIISYFFPPYNSIGAVRMGKTARYLMARGHDVRVVAADKQSWKGRLPTTLRLEIPEDYVIYSGIGAVYFLIGLFIRLFTRGESSNGHFGWFPFAYLAARRLIKRWRPDVIYASGLPFTAWPVAHWLSIQNHIPWVAELRDLWSDNPRYPKWRSRIEDRWERSTLRSASGLVTVSEPLAKRLREKYDMPVIVSYNGFDLGNRARNSSLPGSNNHRLQIVYTGTIYKKWQDPTPLFVALQRLGSLAAKVCVSFYGPELDFVNELAEELDVHPFVEVYEPVSYDESLRLQARADVLLLLQWTDSREKGIFTGKLFEYIGACRPVLSVGPTDNEPAELIVNKGFGVALIEPDAIEAQLRQWIIQKQQSGIPSLPIETTLPYSRDSQIKYIEQFLQEITLPIINYV